MTHYLVRGNYCPTDANPEKDAHTVVSEVRCQSLEEARTMLLWYPGGRIIVTDQEGNALDE